MTALSRRFREALGFAAVLHADQVRKAGSTPYVAHLLAVSAMVLEDGGGEDEAIAALLHDAVEDQGGRATLERIEGRFGATVARIVAECSDTDVQPKPPWHQRKEAYLKHLEHVSESTLRVALADKLHNLRSLLVSVEDRGLEVFDDFRAGPQDQVWLFGSLADLFERRLPGRMARQFAREVGELRAHPAGQGSQAVATAQPPGQKSGRTCATTGEETRRLVNLTPHPVVVVLGEDRELVLSPSGTIARVRAASAPAGRVEGVPLVETLYGELLDMPASDGDRLFITSTLVAQAAAALGRTDVVSPDTGPDSVLRDPSGRIIAVRRLQRFAAT